VEHLKGDVPMSRTHRSFTKVFKLKVVQAYQAGVAVASLTREFDIHANLVYKWTKEYQDNPGGAFRGSTDLGETNTTGDKRIAELERLLGRMTLENDFLKKALKHAESALVKAMPENGQG
jgi:transposase